MHALVVASWYPAVDDPIAGRFVADQVEALAATGGIRLCVVSFEPAAIVGAGRVRDSLAAVTGRLAAGAVRTHGAVFGTTPSRAPHGVPTARLTIAGGRYPAGGPGHAAASRSVALGALADGWLSADASAARLPPLPGLVHAHAGYPDGVAAAGLARRLGVPLIVTEHSSAIARQLAAPEVLARYRSMADQAARFVVVSRTLGAEVSRLLPELANRLVVIPNTVDVEAFRAMPSATRRPELVYVGYRKATKGLEALLRAYAIVRRSHPEVTLRLVGGSPSPAIEAGWHELAAALGVADGVTFDGPADRAGVADALASASVFVHPSPRETFGVVAVEALASGLPVVAADSGGVTEILGDHPDRLGAIVEPGDPAALAAGIADVLGRLDRFDRAGLRGAVVERYGAAAVGRRIADLYEQVVGEHSPGSAHVGLGRPTAVSQHSPPAARPEAPVRVVVALDPDRAALVRVLPASTRARLVVVTAAPGPVPDGVASVLLADVGSAVRVLADALALGPAAHGWRRIARAIRHPLAVARRRGLLPGPERLVSTRGTAAIREAITRAAALSPKAGVELVCLDGLDHLAAAPLIDASIVPLAPGGLRWLGDRADAEGRRDRPAG